MGCNGAQKFVTVYLHQIGNKVVGGLGMFGMCSGLGKAVGTWGMTL